MISTRCAACKYLRKRCDTDCIFSPYFPSNDPLKFACVHKIFGASNVGKMLKQLPVHHRAEAANSLCFEAQSRIQDPVYGCTGIISLLQQQIYNAQKQLAIARAEIALNAHQAHLQGGSQFQQIEASSSFNNVAAEPLHVDQSFFDPPWLF
ncbi:hypothetical protein HHK36_000290 [Tetracentron sinense]|uniref:LOB domain-containing protein n=1 Tax=Tetracentron sinense TaxID=13715 RepID=A0A834ZW44_TETSI|nr:hypothetical protein HHK36_000290 [Tetracentron sinense]